MFKPFLQFPDRGILQSNNNDNNNCDINIQCDTIMEARTPDLFLVDKKGKSSVIVDIAVPGDCRVREKELEKNEKYQN